MKRLIERLKFRREVAEPKPQAVVAKDEAAYLAESRAWEAQWFNHQVQSTRRAWAVAYAACAVCIILAGAIFALMPLKEKVVGLVRVDNSTGIVEPIEWITNGKVTYEEAITRRDVWRFVLCMESYTRAGLNAQFDECRILAGPEDQVQKHMITMFLDHKNEQSLFGRYGEKGWAKLHFKGITFLNPSLAQLRFMREERTANDEKVVQTHWQSTVAFRYTGAGAAQSKRLVNDLGFQVTMYRVDLETVPSTPKPEAQ